MKAIELLKKEMVEGIDSVISGKIKEFKSTNITPSMVVDYLDTFGWNTGELESNGWQYDWWITFTKDNMSFTAFGSGYDGTFEFKKSE